MPQPCPGRQRRRKTAEHVHEPADAYHTVVIKEGWGGGSGYKTSISPKQTVLPAATYRRNLARFPTVPRSQVC